MDTEKAMIFAKQKPKKASRIVIDVWRKRSPNSLIISVPILLGDGTINSGMLNIEVAVSQIITTPTTKPIAVSLDVRFFIWRVSILSLSY